MAQDNNPDYLKRTSSFNDYLLCDYCGEKFATKGSIKYHIHNQVCRSAKNSDAKCDVCGQSFGNRGAMASHRARMHNPSSSKKRVKCDVCNFTFASFSKLRYHIRREHFNLIAKIPYCNQKKVNQVWFERVLNCNSIVEIHKTGPNTLVMRGLDKNTAIKVVENNTQTVDLSHLYPR